MRCCDFKEICKEYNIRPIKSLGQNFLIDKNILNKIIKTADLKKSDIVLEIGPGLGVLTKELAKIVKKVIAVEKDKKLADVCTDEMNRISATNVEIINQDILKVDLKKLGLKNKKYKIVANIPYKITSPILKKFLSSAIKPCELILLVQKEVAVRITSKAPEMSILAISVGFYGRGKIIHNVSKMCFWPKPKVDSAILKISIENQFNFVDDVKFFKIVRAGFSSKRKQLKNNLAKILGIDIKKVIEVLQKINLSQKIRAQELSLDQWIDLFKKIHKL